MFPVLDSSALQQADARTIRQQGITSWALMERAAVACTSRILAHVRSDASFLVMVGMGNNGGDGLAIARLLAQQGRKVRVGQVRHRGSPSPDNERNRELLTRAGIRQDDSWSALPVEEDVIVDCLLGTGADRVPQGPLREGIQWINAAGRPVISIDLPSGLWAAENAQNDPEAIVVADLVLTLGAPKPALLLPENGRFVQRWELVPINLIFSSAGPSAFNWLEGADVAGMVRPRPRTGHKGTFGHALLVAGSARYAGAAVITARAALRSGCGLVTLGLPEELVGTVHMAVPEAIGMHRGELLVNGGGTGTWALGVGPGLGMDAATQEFLWQLLERIDGPTVFDADALTMLAMRPDLLEQLPLGSILTPHPKEFDRLCGIPCATGFDRLGKARAFAQRTRTIVVLKGAHTAICSTDGRVYFNPSGNNGMAKGGSGDALTGLLTGLLAQGYSPLDASIIGVYLHGLAGDLAAAKLGPDGMTVSDMIAQLPSAWRHLRSSSEQALH